MRSILWCKKSCNDDNSLASKLMRTDMTYINASIVHFLHKSCLLRNILAKIANCNYRNTSSNGSYNSLFMMSSSSIKTNMSKDQLLFFRKVVHLRWQTDSENTSNTLLDEEFNQVIHSLRLISAENSNTCPNQYCCHFWKEWSLLAKPLQGSLDNHPFWDEHDWVCVLNCLRKRVLLLKYLVTSWRNLLWKVSCASIS